jgi:hypothetical protein
MFNFRLLTFVGFLLGCVLSNISVASGHGETEEPALKRAKRTFFLDGVSAPDRRVAAQVVVNQKVFQAVVSQPDTEKLLSTRLQLVSGLFDTMTTYLNDQELRRVASANRYNFHRTHTYLINFIRSLSSGPEIPAFHFYLPFFYESPMVGMAKMVMLHNINSIPPEAQRKVIEAFALRNDPEAVRLKLSGLLDERHGYPRNIDATHAFAREKTAERNPGAITWQIERWSHSEKPADESVVRSFITEHARQGHGRAVEEEIRSLTRVDVSTAHRYVDEQIAKGVSEAISWKITGLTEGLYDYQVDIPAARALIDEHAGRGHARATLLKLDGLRGCMYQGLVHDKNIEEFNRFIKEGTLKRNGVILRWQRRHLKFYKRDHAAAAAFLKEYFLKGGPQYIEEEFNSGGSDPDFMSTIVHLLKETCPLARAMLVEFGF